MSLIVIEELQDYLVAQGVGSLPSAAPSTTLPRIYLAGRDGAPLPAIPDETTAVTLRDTLLAPAAALEAFLEEAFVDIIVRSTSAPTAKLTHRTIRNLLHPAGSHGGRKQWEMGALTVEYSTIWRGEQELPPPSTAQDVRGDVRTYDRVASYRIGARRVLLA
jgi:hypothetical protein